MEVALVAERIADHADVVGTAQADMRERANLIHDRLERGGVVIEDRHQPLGAEGQRAFVRGAELAFAIRVRSGYEDVVEIFLHRGRVGARPTRPRAAQDVRAAHERDGVVAQIEHRLAAAKRSLRCGPREQDVVRLLRVGGVAGEIPHAREIPDRHHVAAPLVQVHMGGARHLLEWPAHFILELRVTVGGQSLEAALPGLALDVGLENLEILAGQYHTWMRESRRGKCHGPSERRLLRLERDGARRELVFSCSAFASARRFVASIGTCPVAFPTRTPTTSEVNPTTCAFAPAGTVTDPITLPLSETESVAGRSSVTAFGACSLCSSSHASGSTGVGVGVGRGLRAWPPASETVWAWASKSASALASAWEPAPASPSSPRNRQAASRPAAATRRNEPSRSRTPRPRGRSASVEIFQIPHPRDAAASAACNCPVRDGATWAAGQSPEASVPLHALESPSPQPEPAR